VSTILASPASVNNLPGLSLLPRKISDEEAPPYDGQASRRREPFLMISHEVFREYAPKAGPVAWSVFTALVFHADAEGRCFPAHATLCTECGIGSRTTVITALSKLADLGMIRVETRRVESGAKTSNSYVLLVGVHVQKMDIPMFTSGTSHVQEMDIPCPEYEQELDPVNKIQLTKTENTPKPPKGEVQAPNYTAEFEDLWIKYPKGSNKKRAFDQWKRVRPSPDTIRAMHDGLDRWKACGKWRRGFVTHAERWIRDRQWEDDPPEDRNDAAPNGTHYANGKDIGLSNDDLEAIIRGER
jgi:hypothetical protein